MKLMTLPVKAKGETEAKLSLSYRFKRELAGNLYPSVSDYPSSIRYPTVDSGRSCTDVTKLTLELVIKMAKDIKDVSWIHGMDMYASVIVREGTIIKNRSNTSIAFGVYKDPIWDHAIRFSLDESLARGGRLTLSVQLINRLSVTRTPTVSKYAATLVTVDIVQNQQCHTKKKVGAGDITYSETCTFGKY
ncbi:hypothetical protein F2Q69_00056722 [Brassica cretica]|uniref:C2 domain-containing protein n=1 Tax=Brassica cretica TaxID=69181 RepID=A0A8S9MTZ0_BRACR|nr:hypothetical protein F2Q69_00056722 [Brassica cretica]